MRGVPNPLGKLQKLVFFIRQMKRTSPSSLDIRETCLKAQITHLAFGRAGIPTGCLLPGKAGHSTLERGPGTTGRRGEVGDGVNLLARNKYLAPWRILVFGIIFSG